ncbi:hypothetical protein BJ165DRAFT_1347805 [Panaeolus papilionaceus]|nr:hypothetical protein BJ165DRAFT_1347805 [Panaeolus papilionaceus]
MPELKLIYRFLRKVSDWTVAGYYSDVYIEGEENVPKDGPLIIASTHHNEMIDIATLAATIPHRRHLSFWAKSTMFANPIAAEIMSSTGAIPVKRNLNAGGNATSNASISPKNASIHNPNPNANSTTNTNASPTPSRTSLFSSTSHTLANGGVIGVFPEGTSYTQARIVQVMSGAGWAGVEYLKLWRERQHRKGRDGTRGASGLRIVPVSVVYTDKARYRSKIVVRYGAPILMDDYFDHLFRDIEDSENGSDSDSETDERSKDIVKKVTKRVEEALLGMTINAGDWDTICATSMARTILWGSEEGAPLKNWVEVSQRLVKELEVSPNPETTHLHKALSKYYALLHHSKTKHSILTSLVPLSSSTPRTAALILKSTLSLLKHTIPTLPFTILFVPSFILFLPGYISGSLASRFLAVRGEEESPAQFKAVGGGLGVGAGLGIGLGLAKLNNWPSGNVMSGLLKSVVENAKELSPSWIGAFIGDVIGKFKGTVVERIGSLGIESLVHLLAQIERTGGRWAKSSAVLLAIWANVFFLSRWHSMLIDVNYRM